MISFIARLLGDLQRTHCLPKTINMENKFKFIARRGDNFMKPGEHLGVIEKVELVYSPEKDVSLWSDPTPQVRKRVVNAKGEVINSYDNLGGFMKFTDLSQADRESRKYQARGKEGYAVNRETNMRVLSEEKEAQALEIFGRVAADIMQTPHGQDVEGELEDLVGKSVVVTVEISDVNGKARCTAITSSANHKELA